MSYKTVEVELENGRVKPSGREALPQKAHALLTILTPAIPEAEKEQVSLAELGRDFVGIGNGTHTNLSYNRKHMDDFGR